MIYLDNNATTVMPKEVLQEMIAWTNKGNPSASYKSAKDSCVRMSEFREFIARACNFTNYTTDAESPAPKDMYQIVFTSGASESNNTIVRSTAMSYKYHTGVVPHVVSSTIEHKSMLECCKELAEYNLITLTLLTPDAGGFISPKKLKEAIRPNTCLVSIMSANNETGAINDITALGKIAHERQVPFHTDAVQSFGKFLINPVKSSVDAFSVSFHKLHGPAGIGLLVIKRAFIEGFKLRPQICGTQNLGFRGGTENIPAIAAAFAATKYTWVDRAKKNAMLLRLKKAFIAQLGARVHTQTYTEWTARPTKRTVSIVIFSPATSVYLPNTVLLSVCKTAGEPFCNSELKKALATRGIIVSIGSACNTASAKSSHVLADIPKVLTRGTIRVSFGDSNTMDQLQFVVDAFTDCIALQTTDI